MSRIHFESVAHVSPDDDASDRARRAQVPIGRAIVGAILISAVAVGLAWFQSRVDDPAAVLTWTEVTEDAQRSQRNIVAFFSRPDCIPCLRMRSETFADPAVRELLARGWILHEIDLDTAGAASLAARYGVSAPPTIVLAAAGGNVLRDALGEPISATGYLDAVALRELFNRDRAGGAIETRAKGRTLRPGSARAAAG